MTIPARIGKYLIRRELGKGSMGTVYEGFDPVIERPVAIKTILAEYLTNVESDSAVARFKREAQAAGRLQHPGIVSVYEYGEDAEMAFIVMEYVPGKPLRQVMHERGRFAAIDAFEVMKQLLAALDYSHRHGVVHRDIKPANVLVLGGLKIKVTDFGVARIESSSLTQVGMVMGTPTHIAPEQLAGLPADGRADLWSAGVILYELLTGHGPFVAETPLTVMHKVMHVDPPPPSSRVNALPQAFDALLAHALAKRPGERFQSAREFANALVAAFIQGAGGRTRPSPGQAPGAGPAPLPIAAETLAAIESSLVRSIGPLARHLVRQGARQARSIDEFYARLADNLPEGVERDAFRAQVEGLRRAHPAQPPTPVGLPEAGAAKPAVAFDPATLAAAEKRLARYLGPLARVLIKRAANDSGDVKELYRKLAEHIDSPAERVAFLRSLH